VNADDEEAMTEDQKRAQASALRKAQKANTRGFPAPSRFEEAGEQSQANTQMTTRSMAKSTKGNEGDQRLSKKLVPIKASRAGGLRSAVGSGSMSTCVAKGHPL
jgi:pyruvate dehydrogenase complex dehydrogenase (E1) component